MLRSIGKSGIVSHSLRTLSSVFDDNFSGPDKANGFVCVMRMLRAFVQ